MGAAGAEPVLTLSSLPPEKPFSIQFMLLFNHMTGKVLKLVLNTSGKISYFPIVLCQVNQAPFPARLLVGNMTAVKFGCLEWGMASSSLR